MSKYTVGKSQVSWEIKEMRTNLTDPLGISHSFLSFSCITPKKPEMVIMLTRDG